MQVNEQDDPLLNRKQAARYTNNSHKSFETWDSRKTYDLKPVKIRGKVYYRQSILDAFSDWKTVRNGQPFKA